MVLKAYLGFSVNSPNNWLSTDKVKTSIYRYSVIVAASINVY